MRIQAWLLLRRSSQRGLLLKVLEQNVSKSFHRNKFCSTSNLLLRLFFVCKCLVPYLVIFTFLKMPENNLLGGGGGVWYQIVKQFHKFGSCSHSTSFDVRNLDPNVFSEGALEGLSVFDPPTSFRISAFWNTPEMSLFKGAKQWRKKKKKENASILILFLWMNGLCHCLLGSRATIRRYADNTLVNLLTYRYCQAV